MATFTFDANPGATRTGTLTIAGTNLTVTQAGSSYVAANQLFTPVASGVRVPRSVAVDVAGNVYIGDASDGQLEEWNAATQNLSTLASLGLGSSAGLAVGASGNVYIAAYDNNTIEEWSPSSGMLSTLVSSGLSGPQGVAVDALGNVYVADAGNNAIKEWRAATGEVRTLVSSGLDDPTSVAVDGVGNVYIADTNNSAIKEWNASTETVSTLVSSGLYYPTGVAVDGAGNVYIADNGSSSVREWNAATQTLGTLDSSGLENPSAMAVDGSGNVYVLNYGEAAIDELPRAFVSIAAVGEGAAAGTGMLAAVLPASEPLTGGFAPSSDQSWLNIGSVSDGVVDLSFTADTGGARTADVTVLGQEIAVTQAGVLATTALVEGAAAGSDSDFVTLAGPWTATANASWLHTTSSGNGDGLATFTFDANTGPARTGTLTIAGQTLTVTQTAALGESTLFESAAAGNDSDAVNFAGRWTATANASWLHTSSRGNGNGLATFTFDANPGATRTGTLTIAGETLTVTQLGTLATSVVPSKARPLAAIRTL